MIRSMTAFASNDTKIGNLTITCELRSVNHRYHDLSFKLPEQLRFTEAALRHLVTEKIKRGKVECTFNYKKSVLYKVSGFNINFEALKTLLQATADIEQHMRSSRSFSALDVLAFPGISQEQEIDKEQIRQSVLDLMAKTLQQMLETREREGMQTAQSLTEKCQKMQEFVKIATTRIPEVLAYTRTRLVDKINEAVANPNLDRLEQELVLLAQKLDVNEELERLQSHITEVLRVLQQSEPVGRRLDFLMQELNREANTLGSKSVDKEMTQVAIELKVIVEQMRELVQNIE
ncbi:MAG: YicC/YloC family endoribonuclease [Methylococcales bacterium]